MVLAFYITEKDGKMERKMERQKEPKIQFLAYWKTVDFFKKERKLYI